MKKLFLIILLAFYGYTAIAQNHHYTTKLISGYKVRTQNDNATLTPVSLNVRVATESNAIKWVKIIEASDNGVLYYEPSPSLCWYSEKWTHYMEMHKSSSGTYYESGVNIISAGIYEFFIFNMRLILN